MTKFRIDLTTSDTDPGKIDAAVARILDGATCEACSAHGVTRKARWLSSDFAITGPAELTVTVRALCLAHKAREWIVFVIRHPREALTVVRERARAYSRILKKWVLPGG